jgi:hypothetical protein
MDVWFGLQWQGREPRRLRKGTSRRPLPFLFKKGASRDPAFTWYERTWGLGFVNFLPAPAITGFIWRFSCCLEFFFCLLSCSPPTCRKVGRMRGGSSRVQPNGKLFSFLYFKFDGMTSETFAAFSWPTSNWKPTNRLCLLEQCYTNSFSSLCLLFCFKSSEP